MKKNIFTQLLFLFVCYPLFSQTNLVGNHSFETGPNTPHFPCQDAGYFDFDSDIDKWRNAEVNPNSCNALGQHHCSQAEWWDYNLCTPAMPQPKTSDRCIRLQTGYGHDFSDGIRTELSQTLEQGKTYKLKFKFAAEAVENLTLHIYFTEKGKRWFDNGQKLEITRFNQAELTPYNAYQWYTIERYFTVPNDKEYSKLKNIVFYYWNELQGVCFLDDIELYDNGCCLEYMVYQNTSALPDITRVDKYIVAGNSVNPYAPPGDVNILPGQNVSFYAGVSYSVPYPLSTASPGFYAAPGSNFFANIEACTPTTSLTLWPIRTSIIPNVFSPNNDGDNDRFCITAQGYSSYHVKIYNRHGKKVYEAFNDFQNADANNYTNSINANYQCLWDGSTGPDEGCVSQGQYNYSITLFNCNESANFLGTVNKIDPGCRLNGSGSSIDSMNIVNAPNHVLVTPNPSAGLFTLITNEKEVSSVFIYDGFGRVVYNSSNLFGNQIVLNLSSQPNGVYFLKVQTGESVYSHKLVVSGEEK
ncbi:MAG: T9SS type A sorting domain-containing protein [Bacteroidetes bacterium]|nr:MAG: T9SS type A sorting domain-containing protein [Bacteroidota bacterium]